MRTLLLALLLSCMPALADDWGPVQFLVGHWTGEGSGQPGNGTGAFSFAPDLQDHVMVRKSFAEYPSAAGKPASRHDDLMILYRDEVSHDLTAVYFDSEGHVIHYKVSANGQAAVFVSEAPAGQPRFRLTYTPNGKDSVKLRFEIAPPGKDFTTYLEAGARRD